MLLMEFTQKSHAFDRVLVGADAMSISRD